MISARIRGAGLAVRTSSPMLAVTQPFLFEKEASANVLLKIDHAIRDHRARLFVGVFLFSAWASVSQRLCLTTSNRSEARKFSDVPYWSGYAGLPATGQGPRGTGIVAMHRPTATRLQRHLLRMREEEALIYERTKVSDVRYA